MKICCTCKEKKANSEFYLRVDGCNDMLKSDCKDCTCIKRAERYHEIKEGINLPRKNIPDYKKCQVCGAWKLKDKFNKRSGMRHGLSNACRECK